MCGIKINCMSSGRIQDMTLRGVDFGGGGWAWEKIIESVEGLKFIFSMFLPYFY